MKPFMKIAGIYGRGFNSAGVWIAPSRKLSVEKLFGEFGIEFNEKAIPEIMVFALPPEEIKSGWWTIVFHESKYPPKPPGGWKEWLKFDGDDLNGVLDINRFLIIGKTKYGWASPTHLIFEAVESGMTGWAYNWGIFETPKLREGSLRWLELARASVKAGKPKSCPPVNATVTGAVTLPAAGTAFDIKKK